MEDPSIVHTLAPYAALAFFLAGIMWAAVGKEAIKRADRQDGGAVFSRLGVAAYITSAAFLLGFFAWLG